MKYYNIYINGTGGELVLGTITKTQYEFWSDRQDEMADHLFDPESDDEVSDEDDPRYLGYFEDLDDITHVTAINIYTGYLCIDEIVNKESYKISKEIISSTELEDFIEEYNCKISKQEFDWMSFSIGTHYVFQGLSIEKGCFHNSVIELDDDEELDLSKIEFTTMKYPNGEVFIEDWSYSGKELDNDADASGEPKGSDFGLLKCKREGDSFQIEDR